MSAEGFEEWDADFLDQLIQVEEMAISCTNPTVPQPLPYLSSYLQPQPEPPSLPTHYGVSHGNISYSPPRELSQRIKNSGKSVACSSNGSVCGGHITGSSVVKIAGNGNELEIDRLKRELGRVSKQLTHLEQECSELRKERDKKKEQLISVSSHIDVKDADVRPSKASNVGRGSGVLIRENPGVSTQSVKANAVYDQEASRMNTVSSNCKEIGVQTEKAGDSTHSRIENDLSTNYDLPVKLLAVWRASGRNLFSKLFADSANDFSALFECLSVNMSLDLVSASHFYSVLTRVSNGAMPLEALLEALLDLCNVKNVVVVHRSLRVLRVVLKYLLRFERNCGGRDNLEFEGPSYNKNILVSNGCESAESGPSASFVDWDYFFEMMCQIATCNDDEHVRLEAISIMNVILMRSNAFLDREKFGKMVLFESVSQFLRKEAGIIVQKQAVHLLYLLLNCPKLLAVFCLSFEEDGETVEAGEMCTRNSSAFQVFTAILDSLADCISCCGSSLQELELRRNAVVVLAFLASSGKCGFEVLLSYKPSKGTNYLMLILRVLISEAELEEAEGTEPPEIFKERTLLMREALILLNRLVSNSAYSNVVLQVLTNSREMASLTIDVTNRLSSKVREFCCSDSITRQMRESEIVGLATIFKKRVFTYLGENVS